VIDDAEFQRRYDLIAQHHLEHYLEFGVNPWMSQEPQLRRWTVGKVVEWVPLGSKILDAACGIGLMLSDLSAAYEATGIDISADYVQHAREQGLDAEVGWLENLPFDTDTFDAAVCSDAMEHVQYPDRVLAELKRVIKPEGVLVVRVPDGIHTGVGNDGGFGFPVHLQSWDKDELQSFLGGTLLGYEIMENELVMGVRL
jgi:SAM-dependent methyltransferase